MTPDYERGYREAIEAAAKHLCPRCWHGIPLIADKQHSVMGTLIPCSARELRALSPAPSTLEPEAAAWTPIEWQKGDTVIRLVSDKYWIYPKLGGPSPPFDTLAEAVGWDVCGGEEG